MRAEKLQETYDIDLRIHHFPLHPETPDAGRTLEELFAGRGIDVAASQERLANVMKEEGLPYAKRTMTYNSRRAQELAKWAESKPDGDKIHRALFEAYFVERSNIAKNDVLIDVVKKVGLPVDEAQQILESREFGLSVEMDWKRCREYGLSGVPVFAIGMQGVSGAQPMEVLEKLVVQAGAKKR